MQIKIPDKKTLAKNYVFIILAIIILLGGFLRLYGLGKNSFVADEFLDINSSYGYFKTHVWQAWDFNMNAVSKIDLFAPRDERAWLYKWQVAQVFRHFPPTEEVARSISVAWGILTILLMYYAGKFFTKKKEIGLMSAFLFAISITAIAFDRKLRMYAMFYPLYLAFSILLFRFFEEDYLGKSKIISLIRRRFGINLLFLLPLLIVAFASFSIQQLSINIAAVFLAYAGVYAIIKARKKQLLNKYSVVAVGALIGAILAYIVAPVTVRWYLGVVKFFINNQEYFVRILRDYDNYLLVTLFTLSGIYFLAKEKLNKEALWLSISLFVPLFMAAFIWKRTQGIQYVFFLQSFLIILLSSGIYFWAKFFENSVKNFPKKAFYSTLILSFLVLPDYSYFLSNDNTYQRDITQVADYRSIFIYVKKNFQPGEVIITRNFRNYYLSGLKAPIYDFGGEREVAKLSLADIQQIQKQNPAGWVVLFDNDDDFIAKDAVAYITQSMTAVTDKRLKGKFQIYRWKL